jgi:hypothetical protein
MEKYNINIEKILKDANINIVEIQKELVKLYIGEGWFKYLGEVILTNDNDSSLKKIMDLYNNVNSALIPDKIDLVTYAFHKVHFENVKLIINPSNPKIIQSLLSADEIEMLYSKNILILPDILTMNAEGNIDELHFAWKEVTEDLLKKLSHLKTIKIEDSITKEELINIIQNV